MTAENPFLAPQAPLVKKTVAPVTPITAPSMEPVARGLGLVLGGVILLIITLVVQIGLLFWLQSKPEGSIAKPDLLALTIAIALFSGMIYVVADVLNVLGFARCANTPYKSIRGLVKVALIATAVAIVCRFVSLVMQMKGLIELQPTGPLPMILELIAAVLGLIAFIAFVAYLRKTAVQLAEPRAMKLSKTLLRSCYALIGLVIATILIVIVGDIGPDQMPRSPIFITGVAITGLGALVMFLCYIVTIRQIRNDLQTANPTA